LNRHTPTLASVVCHIILCCALLLVLGHVMVQPSAGDSKSAQRFSASSIQIEPTDPGDVPMPPEFRVAIYENLIAQIKKTGKFQHVYRSGDQDAAKVADLVTLRTAAQAFKKGSQKQREVTTVMGATSLTLSVHITDHSGQTIVDRDVQGKVRFMGENLGATYDFSKKVAKIVRDTF
jgi:hypothetical protein